MQTLPGLRYTSQCACQHLIWISLLNPPKNDSISKSLTVLEGESETPSTVKESAQLLSVLEPECEPIIRLELQSPWFSPQFSIISFIQTDGSALNPCLFYLLEVALIPWPLAFFQQLYYSNNLCFCYHIFSNSLVHYFLIRTLWLYWA